MNNHLKKVIIFDFDGVIADTFQMALNIKRMIDPSIIEAEYRRRFEGNINYHQDEKIEVRSSVDWFAEYTAKINEQPVFPGMPNVIAELTKKYSLVIVSSTTTGPIDQFLRHNSLRQYFAEILGNDVDTSKVKKFGMIFNLYSGDTDNYLVITDTLGDLRAARAINLRTLAVTWGFHSAATLSRGKPTAMVNRPEDIPNKLSEIFDQD